MDHLALAAAAATFTNNPSLIRLLIPSYGPERRRIRNLSFPRKPSQFIVFASKHDPKLDRWDHLELSPGYIVGEDTEITHAKPLEQNDVESAEKGSAANAPLETKLVDSYDQFSMEAVLQGKPNRLEQSVKRMPNFSRVEMAFMTPESYGNAIELENFLATSPIKMKEHEDNDWRRVENLFRTGDREEVELISSSTRGFVVSFGTLIGFLPYRNLAARWKFLALESWLRTKGLEPSASKDNPRVTGNYGIENETSLNLILGPEIGQKIGIDISCEMKPEDLLRVYDQEKLKFLSSFVGQKIKVNVIMADRKSRRLIFSVMPKEKEEMIEKKRSLMAKLSNGDAVKCCIKKITYFGIFVEVEGVPAVIRLTEVSWDASLDPALYFKVGQIVETKVHRLDFYLERIFLSLKDMRQMH